MKGGGVAGRMARDSRRGQTQNCPATLIPEDGGWSVAERGVASADGGVFIRAPSLQLGTCKRRTAKRWSAYGLCGQLQETSGGPPRESRGADQPERGGGGPEYQVCCWSVYVRPEEAKAPGGGHVGEARGPTLSVSVVRRSGWGRRDSRSALLACACWSAV